MFPSKMQYTFVSKLSGGEKRRLYLLTILMKNPNFLILDEPTNDLDLLTLNKLEEFLLDFKGCLILVSHDRYFLDKITGWILELDRGKGIPYEGNYSSWLEQKSRRMEQEAREVSYYSLRSVQGVHKEVNEGKKSSNFTSHRIQNI